jgi:hypothetical protein
MAGLCGPPTHLVPTGADERYGEGSNPLARHCAKEAILLPRSRARRGGASFLLEERRRVQKAKTQAEDYEHDAH